MHCLFFFFFLCYSLISLWKYGGAPLHAICVDSVLKNHFRKTHCAIFIQSYSRKQVTDAALLRQPVTPSSVFRSTKQEFVEGIASLT